MKVKALLFQPIFGDGIGNMARGQFNLKLCYTQLNYGNAAFLLAQMG